MDWYHMATDDLAEGGLEELHVMARRLGLRPQWLHHHPGLPHYDVPDEVKREAIDLGAVEVSTRELVRRCRRTGAESDAMRDTREEGKNHEVVESPARTSIPPLQYILMPRGGKMDRNNGYTVEPGESGGYSPERIDQWLRAWTLLTRGSSERLAKVRSDLESAAARLDHNSPGRLAVEMRMKGNNKQQIARALGVSNTRGAAILRDAQEQMARHLGWEGTGSSSQAT